MLDNPAIQKIKIDNLVLLLENILHEPATDYYSYVYKIYLQDAYAQIGHISYKPHLSPAYVDRGNIGYSIRKRHRRKGYAVTACRGLLNMLKDNGVSSVTITCDKDHYATPQVCAKLGGTFSHETKLKYHYLIPTDQTAGNALLLKQNKL